MDGAKTTELAHGLECDSPRMGHNAKRAEPTVVFHRSLTNLLPGEPLTEHPRPLSTLQQKGNKTVTKSKRSAVKTTSHMHSGGNNPEIPYSPDDDGRV